jgi:hypothetical protein
MGALAIFALLGCDQGRGDSEQPTAGDVRFLSDEGVVQTAGVHADAGSTVVFGATAVRNYGLDPAILEAGSLLGAPAKDSAAVVAVRVREISGGGDLVGGALWPFEDYAERSAPLEGYSLAPSGEAELLLVIRVANTGEWYWPTTMLRYTANGVAHEVETSFGFLVCPTDVERCDVPHSNS